MRLWITIALLTLATCGDSVENDPSNAGPVDAGLDAGFVNALGRSCTGDGQGDCPDGWICLQNNWCSMTWGAGGSTEPDCTTDYEGPGIPACTLVLRDDTAEYCAILCYDENDEELCSVKSGESITEVCASNCPSNLDCVGINPEAANIVYCDSNG